MHKKRKTAENEITSSTNLEVGSIMEPSSSDIVSLLKGINPITNDTQGVHPTTEDKGSVDSNGWTKVEKRKEKKAKKEAQNALNQPPMFALNVQQLTKMRIVSISVCTLLMTFYCI
jgi:hypothetical protein